MNLSGICCNSPRKVETQPKTHSTTPLTPKDQPWRCAPSPQSSQAGGNPAFRIAFVGDHSVRAIERLHQMIPLSDTRKMAYHTPSEVTDLELAFQPYVISA